LGIFPLAIPCSLLKFYILLRIFFSFFDTSILLRQFYKICVLISVAGSHCGYAGEYSNYRWFYYIICFSSKNINQKNYGSQNDKINRFCK
jgi:hypothetical protein